MSGIINKAGSRSGVIGKINGIGQLIGVTSATGASASNYVTLENNKTYHIFNACYWANTVVANGGYQTATVNGSGTVTLVSVNMLNSSFELEITTNAIRQKSSGATGYGYHFGFVFEEGTTFDNS